MEPTAPTSAFKADLTPVTPSAVPYQRTGYDEGIGSLAASYFGNGTLAGSPVTATVNGATTSVTRYGYSGQGDSSD